MSGDSEDYRAIIDAIRKIAVGDKLKSAVLKVGEVKSVDEDNRQCAVLGQIDEGGILYETVNLMAENNDGWLIVPAIGSTVLFHVLPNGDSYVSMFSDITAAECYIDASNNFRFDSTGFVWNGGALGGMAKIISLTTKLNDIENKINALLTAISGWTPAPNDGGAALKLALTSWLASALTLTVRTDIEDTKIKH